MTRAPGWVSAGASSVADILVVDDNHEVRELLVVALELAGFDVRATSDGRAALAAIEEKVPDVVVLDVTMPEMDGFEVLRQIRSRRQQPAIRVLMLTTKTAERARLTSWSGGADDYETKPFRTSHLIGRIQRLLDASEEELTQLRDTERHKAGLLEHLERVSERSARRSTPPQRGTDE